ncbi:Phytanoyl-CoA dioxygenase (PhyH) [Prochlorococcus marinus str. MIT 1327]|nr:Phytanoyl-CoA dioxygenase (PhyH) [Prochlorococcus marinus str. MIT 1312]KZR84586.1 Phytanoyl-CoA dioxygenase (PhyH) [Prochlorococcus marinus str. MIT 1327]
MDHCSLTAVPLEESKYLLHKHGHVRINKFLTSTSELMNSVRSYADDEWAKTIQTTNSDDFKSTGGTTEEFKFGLNGKEDTPLYKLASQYSIIRTLSILSEWKSVSLLHAYLFYKSPSGGFTPWHQDNAYLPVDQKAMTIWIPLVDLEEPNGMVFANGSQELNVRWNDIKKKGLHKYFTEHNCHFELVSSLSAGDVDIHDGHVVHCGTDNFMNQTRRVIAIAYISGDARYSIKQVDQHLDPSNKDLKMRQELSKVYFEGANEGDSVKEFLPTFYPTTRMPE